MAARKHSSKQAKAGTSGAKGKPRASQTPPAPRPVLVWTGWSVLLACLLVAMVSLASYNPADRPTFTVDPPNEDTANLAGPVGAVIAHGLYRTLGYPSWIIVVGLITAAAFALSRVRVDQWILRTLGLVVASSAAAGLNALLTPMAAPMPGLAGGVVGEACAVSLTELFGSAGSLIFLFTGLGIGLAVCAGEPIWLSAKWIWLTARPKAASSLASVRDSTGRLIENLKSPSPGASVRIDDLDGDVPGQPATLAKGATIAEAKPSRRRAQVASAGDADASETQAEAASAKSSEPSKGQSKVKSKDQANAPSKALSKAELKAQAKAEAKALASAKKSKSSHLADDDIEPDEELPEIEPSVAVETLGADIDDDDEDDAPGAPQVFDRDKLKEKISRLPVRFSGQSRETATDEDLQDLQNVGELEGYRFPGLDLLAEPEENFSDRLEQHVREGAEALEAALTEFRIQGEVVGIESGPVITLYHIRLAPGTRVNSLQKVSSDIARSLKAVNIRIVPNMAGRDTVGIEVPNTIKEKVRLKELMAGRERFEGMELPMFLGKDASGEPLIEDLTKMPHMLIAGTTGSGKSVCMNSIIVSFLYTKKPNELKLVLVDPKMVEMSQFKDIPHLMSPVVTEMSKAAAILEWAVKKMDERYELLAEAGVRDITGYNDMPWEELKEAFKPKSEQEEARIPRRLPYMVFIIDELADLMMTNKEVEGSIIRIAQKARAVGIHLILATQRPQANVVTGLIKGNMPCRIAFKVNSGLDSRIVLDQKGGELLLGQGDMLLLSPRSHKLSRSQGTLVDEKEIRRVVRFMREVATPTFERQLIQLRSGEVPDDESDEARILRSHNNSSASLAAAQEDPMFDRAVEIVLETKRGSVSLLQRRLAIGYTRASRLIDLMGIAGIISDHKGSVARDVLITPEEWAEMKRIAGEAQPGLFADDPTAPTLMLDDSGDDDESGDDEEAPWDDEEGEESEDEDELWEDEGEESEEDEEGEEDAEEGEEEDEEYEEDEIEEGDEEVEDDEAEEGEEDEEDEEVDEDEEDLDESEDDSEDEDDEDPEEDPDEDPEDEQPKDTRNDKPGQRGARRR